MPVAAMNFVEFSGEADEVERRLRWLSGLPAMPGAAGDDTLLVRDPAQIAQLWSLRETAAGLLARLGGGRQGTAFVEDTAVPPD